MFAELKQRLEDIVGPENVIVGLEERVCYSYDATNLSALPDLVITPLLTDEVVQIVLLAEEMGVPLVPRGAGTGCSGGALSVAGGILLLLARMDRILAIDRERGIGVVEPGVVTAELQRVVEEVGLFYPPIPSSADVSTLGGNMAECAGGLRGKKYGVTKDYVVGLEFVIPGGEVVRTGVLGNGLKGGYDLDGVIIGSEGTLAIITKIALKLVNRPLAAKAGLAGFRSLEPAVRTVQEIILEKGVVPAVLELIDGPTLDCVQEFVGQELLQETGAALFVEVTGKEEEVEVQWERVQRAFVQHRALQVRSATDHQGRERLWRLRRSISPSLSRVAPTKINEDICVPPGKILDLFQAVEEIAKRYRLKILSYGHAGDGNLHVNIMVDRRNPQEMAQAEKALEELFKATLRLGGTLSGEHGIGITKSRYLPLEFGGVELGLHRRVKESFDPWGIMNPGKIFPQVCN